MAKTILHIQFQYDMPDEEMRDLCENAARDISKVEGLEWKIFLIDEPRGFAGGQYLFRDDAAAEAYVKGPIVAGLRGHPAISGVIVRQFGIVEGASKVTRGPIVAERASATA